jgi:hypothetical protein
MSEIDATAIQTDVAAALDDDAATLHWAAQILVPHVRHYVELQKRAAVEAAVGPLLLARSQGLTSIVFGLILPPLRPRFADRRCGKGVTNRQQRRPDHDLNSA